MAGSAKLRVLVLGWTNTPHVVDWAEMLVRLGYEVHVAGRDASDWPAVKPPAGVASWTVVDVAGMVGLRGRRLSRALGEIGRRIQADVVHAHWLPEFGWIAARERLTPLVCSAWGSDVLAPSRLAADRSRTAIHGSTLVLADSTALRSAVLALASEPVQVEVVRWGVDLGTFRPSDPRAARRALRWEETPTVLSMRQLKPTYNPDVIVDSFGRVRAAVPNARLVLKHPEHAVPRALMHTIASSGLDEAISFIGHVEPSHLPLIYQAADVAVSIPSSDSSPRSAWEALACGTPLVVSDLPWARAELLPTEAAELVPVDAVALAYTVSRLLTDKQRRERLCVAGRALAAREVNLDARANQVDALYRDVVRLSAPGAFRNLSDNHPDE